MGFTPREVGEMSLWQFAAAVDGVAKANGADERPEPMSGAEFDAMVARAMPLMTKRKVA